MGGVDDWIMGYVHGNEANLRNALAAAFPPEPGSGKAWEIPGDVGYISSGMYEQEQIGTDEYGNPIYRRVRGRPDVLAMIALRTQDGADDLQEIIDRIPTASYHVPATYDEIKALYPAYCYGPVLHTQPPVRIADPVTVTIGAADASPTLAAVISKDDGRIVATGGTVEQRGQTAPLNQYNWTANRTYADATRSAQMGVWHLRTTSASVEYAIYGDGAEADHRIWVDGQVVATVAGGSVPDDQGRHYILLEWQAAAERQIRIETYWSASIGGLAVPADSDLLQATIDTSPTIAIIGDAWTEGTGATDYREAYAPVTARTLGADVAIISGLSGTGYVLTHSPATGPDSPNLETRISADALAYDPDIVIIAAGTSDTWDASAMPAAIASVLDACVAQTNKAAILAVTPYNSTGAPFASGSDADNIRNAIVSACSARSRCHALDPEVVRYTKGDDTHPDAAGHLTLAKWAVDAARAAIRSDPRLKSIHKMIT